MKMRLYRVADGELIAEYEAKQQRQRTSVLSVAYDGKQLYSETRRPIASLAYKANNS